MCHPVDQLLSDLIVEERDNLRKQLEEIYNPSIQFLREEFSLTQPLGKVLKLCLAGFTQMFIDQGAKNYIEISLRNALDDEFVFTVQKRDGKTPNQLRQEAESRNAKLQKQFGIMMKAANNVLIAYDYANEDDSQIDNELANKMCDVLEDAFVEVDRLEEK